MKYTIASPETEARLATLEDVANGAVGDWELVLLDEKGAENKALLKGARVNFSNGVLEVGLPQPEGSRLVFPAYRQNTDGVFVIATQLGNLRLLPSRGATSEAAGGASSGVKSVKSSMPGKVLKILCKVGDLIEAGQPMLIIEAMKMENEIRCPQTGRVDEIGVQPGQSIQTGDLLVKLGKPDGGKS
ncbi:MAG: acetyl-CoA carboxylase biotin carboxyl carrier protein subunit [Deltaproteobacteria bacterium]|nr:acetyl-CoA carboxylase biotin carboxyl carrier protein subunit [Deltaproteobacteria bacterium]